MKISQLQCFLAVEKYRNFSVAADSLFMSQSNLSKQLLSLEEELGVKLFDRSTHIIKLTREGEAILMNSKVLLIEYEHILNELVNIDQLNKNKLAMAAPLGMCWYDIADMVIAYEKANPNILVESHEKSHAGMLYMLDNRIVDVCIGFKEFWQTSDKYIFSPCIIDELVLIANTKDPISKRTSIHLAEVKDKMFCLPRESGEYFQMFLDMCSKEHFFPKMTMSDVRLSTIKRYIIHNMRYTIATSLQAFTYFAASDFSAVRLENSKPLTLGLLIRNETPSKQLENFVKHATNYFMDASFRKELALKNKKGDLF